MTQLFAGPAPRDGLNLVSSAELQQKNGRLLASERPGRLLSEAAEVCHGSRPGRNLTGATGENQNAGSASFTGPERRRQRPHFAASSRGLACLFKLRKLIVFLFTCDAPDSEAVPNLWVLQIKGANLPVLLVGLWEKPVCCSSLLI